MMSRTKKWYVKPTISKVASLKINKISEMKIDQEKGKNY